MQIHRIVKQVGVKFCSVPCHAFLRAPVALAAQCSTDALPSPLINRPPVKQPDVRLINRRSG